MKPWYRKTENRNLFSIFGSMRSINQNRHSFTRGGVTYDCFARQMRINNERRWTVEVGGQSYLLLKYLGTELRTAEARSAFEDAVIRAVAEHRHAIARYGVDRA